MKLNFSAFKLLTKLIIVFLIILIPFAMYSGGAHSNENNDWTTGLTVGSYHTGLVTEQSILPGGDTPGTLITNTITAITETNIEWDQITNRPDEDPITAHFSMVRHGFDIFMDNARSYVFTTTNTTYLQDQLRTNTSEYLWYYENETHYGINDYFYMEGHHGFPAHYHSYNATYDKITGWRLDVELSHVHLDGSLMGIVRIKNVDYGNNKTSSANSFLFGMLLSAMIGIYLIRRKNQL